MQEKESIMVVGCELKIPSLVITVGHHSERFVTLMREFLICISQPLKILLVLTHLCLASHERDIAKQCHGTFPLIPQYLISVLL